MAIERRRFGLAGRLRVHADSCSRQLRQRQKAQGIADDRASAVTHYRGRVVAEGGSHDPGKPDEPEGGIGVAIRRIAAPADDRRNEEQGRATQYRRAGGCVDVEGRVEDLVDIGVR